MKIILALLLFTTLISCSEEYGNKVKGGNLTVHFIDARDEAIAEKIAVFWKNNDLISSKKQDIQLMRSKKGYRLNLIVENGETLPPMNYAESKALLDLQSMLRDSVFKEKRMEIFLCDNQFNPLYNINK